MGCAELLSGIDLACDRSVPHRYIQKVVLLNKDDVLDYEINTGYEMNNVKFNLKPTKSGLLFNYSHFTTNVSASFRMSRLNNIRVYDHEIRIPVAGVSESVKALIKQLAEATLFAAVKYFDGTIEIHGFENGLELQGYNYEPQSGIGGSILTFVSAYSEYDPPFNYSGDAADFDDLFANVDPLTGTSFNQDYNQDFDAP